jgi:hypothetical protein
MRGRPGVSLVTFRNELIVFYLLSFSLWAPTAPRWLPSTRVSACTSPRSFSLAAPSFALAFFRGYVMDAGGLWGANIAVDGYPVGALLGQSAWWCQW